MKAYLTMLCLFLQTAEWRRNVSDQLMDQKIGFLLSEISSFFHQNVNIWGHTVSASNHSSTLAPSFVISTSSMLCHVWYLPGSTIGSLWDLWMSTGVGSQWVLSTWWLLVLVSFFFGGYLVTGEDSRNGHGVSNAIVTAGLVCIFMARGILELEETWQIRKPRSEAPKLGNMPEVILSILSLGADRRKGGREAKLKKVVVWA